MLEPRRKAECSDCAAPVTRRDFVRATGAAAAALTLGWGRSVPTIGAPPTLSSPPETAVARLFASLKEDQRKAICLPFDDPKRSRINANWAITNLTVEGGFDKDQQALIEEIVKGVTSEDGYERLQKQMDDDSGGLGAYHIAIFGEPGKGPFEFELTGRHLTLRADGNTIDNTAFGGPLIYGHGAGDSEKGLPGNVFYYQTQQANEVFKALDGKQRALALIEDAPNETHVQIQGKEGKFPGIAVGDLSGDQKSLVESVLKTILAPYRADDVEEAMAFVTEGGGLDAIRMAFYQTGDIDEDKEWDIWRLESPTLVCHFRGSPHVHAYINIGRKA